MTANEDRGKLEPQQHSQSRKRQVAGWAGWLVTFCTLLIAGLVWPNAVAAQDTTRKLRSGPPPEYPEIARKFNIKGTARVRFKITSAGKVKDIREIGGNPVLLSALVDAVRKWQYEPAATTTEAEVKFDFP